MSELKQVSDTSFGADVLESSEPTLVDFWAPWCGPCRMVAPIVEELAQEYNGKVNFVKLNTDENPQTPTKYGIRGIPTLIIFKEGKEAGRIVGFKPKGELKKQLDSVLS